MTTPFLKDELLKEAVNLRAEFGGTKQAADNSEIPYGTLLHRCRRADTLGILPDYKRPIRTGIKGDRVLAIPDLHSPFHHPDALPFLAEANKELAPSRIICLGDEADQHALSQYQADPDGKSPNDEFLLSKEFMGELAKLFPVMSICDSNHMTRYLKKAFRAGIPTVYMKSYQDAYRTPPGWTWGDQFTVDGVRYFHGEGFSGKDGAYKAAVQYRMPVVIGHLHAHAGIQYNCNGDTTIFGLNAGCLIDNDAYAFRYGKHIAHKPCIGVGMIDSAVPHWFPMRMDKHKRWVGKL